ncbi:nuclear transport factor 2 family protein [uncultured Flavobacterium sp.]|uniref:nuclear transport factor 2 family protein n=1 Tax=uncultured Flavobacterium sp. TaxID=165435 RepID=UPI0025FAB4D6|nr:nuclear transport factor 2 family protein [uncultured Flavobacterium sp.]
MHNTRPIVQQFLQALSQRDLDSITQLFAEDVDWYIPGDSAKAKWLGRRATRSEVADFYELLWSSTEPVSASIDAIFTEGVKAVISGEFVTKMLATGAIVESLFFIQIAVEGDVIVKYRLLEDSHAVSLALT